MQNFFEDIDQMEFSDEALSNHLLHDCNVEALNFIGPDLLLPPRVSSPDLVKNGGKNCTNNYSSSDPLMAGHLNPVVTLPSVPAVEINSSSNILPFDPKWTMGNEQNPMRSNKVVDKSREFCNVNPVQEDKPDFSKNDCYKSNVLENVQSHIQSVDFSNDLLKKGIYDNEKVCKNFI